jgi:hypothetical protein
MEKDVEKVAGTRVRQPVPDRERFAGLKAPGSPVGPKTQFIDRFEHP